MGQTSAAADNNGFQPSAWHFIALLAGNATLALGPWLVRLSDTGPVAAGFWRLFLPIPILALLAYRARTAEPLDRKLVVLVLAAGFFFALDLASWHIGIERTRLGNATLFGNSGSIILMVWGLITLRRRPKPLELLAVTAAISGAAILMGRSLEISTATMVGDLFCLLAGIFYVCYLLPAQRARAQLGQWTVLLLVSLAGAPISAGDSAGAGRRGVAGTGGVWSGGRAGFLQPDRGTGLAGLFPQTFQPFSDRSGAADPTSIGGTGRLAGLYRGACPGRPFGYVTGWGRAAAGQAGRTAQPRRAAALITPLRRRFRG